MNFDFSEEQNILRETVRGLTLKGGRPQTERGTAN
jgi:hypothetical protein